MDQNLSSQELHGIKELKSFTDIIIKKADKSNTMIVMGKDFYRDKLILQDHLLSPTYKSTDSKADKKVMKDLYELTQKHKVCLTTKEFSYINNKEWKSSQFYVQPQNT